MAAHGWCSTSAWPSAARLRQFLPGSHEGFRAYCGTALVIVGLLSAFLIASLLTLSAVTKRIRELGTLKALGWPQSLVVRQVTGESLLVGLLCGVLGVVDGIGGALLAATFAPTLDATVSTGTGGGPRIFGPFGQAPSIRRRPRWRSTRP